MNLIWRSTCGHPRGNLYRPRFVVEIPVSRSLNLRNGRRNSKTERVAGDCCSGGPGFRRVQKCGGGKDGRSQLLSLGFGGGEVCSGSPRCCSVGGLSSMYCSRTRGEWNRWRVNCLLKDPEGMSDENPYTSSSFQRRAYKHGIASSRNGKRQGFINSRTVKVGLMYRLAQFGRGWGGGSVDGSDGNGRGWGGAAGGGGDGGDGGDGVSFPGSGEGFNFFAIFLHVVTRRSRARLWRWAVSAFLAGLLIRSTVLGDCAHAEGVTTTRILVADSNVGEAEKVLETFHREQDDWKKGLGGGAIWQVTGSQWRRFIIDLEKDKFILDVGKSSEEEAILYEEGSEKDRNGICVWPGNRRRLDSNLQGARVWAGELAKRVFLPAGYPGSVTEGYLEFVSWRMGQIIASQVSAVLTTQALLYAVGLGKGAIPTAAAVNWVLRDGIGYLSKIVLSKYGRHFDVHPKGWRLVSDIIENASYGLELLTPVVPHLFVYLAATAGAGRSAAGLIQAATKSSFNANFAVQRNFAEIIAKGEAQGMASKSVGIGLGILISGYVGSQGPLLMVTFAAVSSLHIFCNLKSYQAVHLRTLNPYRASLVLAEYLKSGIVPTIKDVNAEEPIFFGVAWFDPKPRRNLGKFDTVSQEAKRVAAAFEKKLQLGASFGALVHNKEDADALIDLYSRENYLLAAQGESIKVVLKEGVSPKDMLRAMVQAVYLLNSSNGSYITSGNILNECCRGGMLQVTHRLMEEKFESITQALSEAGWVTDGVLARAAPNRLLLKNQTKESFLDYNPR